MDDGPVTRLVVATLPGVPPHEGPFEFVIDDASRIVHIEADHRGPDVAIARKPAQERWMNDQADLVQTWDCQWTLRDGADLDAFVARLGPVVPPPAPLPAVVVAADPDTLVLAGGPPGSFVELARAGDVAVALGLMRGHERPWDTVARRGPDALDELAAHWRRTFPVVDPASTGRARAHARMLAAHPHLWTVYRYGGIDGATTRRVLDLGDRVVVEVLGPRPRRTVHASRADALARLGPTDVPCDLVPATPDEIAALRALAEPRRRVKAPAAGASFPARVRAALRALDAHDVLGLAGLPGPTSHAWGLATERRERRHWAVVFARRDQLGPAAASLHWWCEEPDRERLFSTVEAVFGGVGGEVTRPADDTRVITVYPKAGSRLLQKAGIERLAKLRP